jgi:uncharacterized protein YgbK (DUF1537 family)
MDPGLMGLGSELRSDPAAALRELARSAADLVRRSAPALLCLEGGQTASVVLDALGWHDLEIFGEVVPGLAALRCASTATVVLVKPGSYPWPECVERRWAESAAGRMRV